MTITTDQNDVTTRLGALADELGAPRPTHAPVRRWVQSPNSGHLSGLVWGAAPAEVVLLHDLGGSSNDWDAVALWARRPLVALDLPGHGRSSNALRIAPPARQAPALLDAVRSLAPAVRLTVAQGFGAAVALQVTLKRPSAVGALLVVDGRRDQAPFEVASSKDVEAAAEALAIDRPQRSPALVRHLAEEATVAGADGRFDWRYQLGEPPAELDSWLSVERFGEPAVPIGVVTTEGSVPVDPLVRSILERWPDSVTHLTVAGGGDDIAGSQAAALVDAIEQFLAGLPPRPDSHDPRHGGRS